MLKRIVSLVLMCLMVAGFTVASAEVMEVTATGTYTIGDGPDENISVAKTRARAEAMRNATEKAGVYIESYTKTKNWAISEDEVKAVAAHILKVKKDDIQITTNGQQITFTCTIIADVDTSDIQSQTAMANRQAIERNAALAKELEALKRENEALKQAYKQAQNKTQQEEIWHKLIVNEENFNRAEKLYSSSFELRGNLPNFVPKTQAALEELEPKAATRLNRSSIELLPNPEKWRFYSVKPNSNMVRWYDPTSIKVLKLGDKRVKVKICFYKPSINSYIIADYIMNYTRHYWAQLESLGYAADSGKEYINSATASDKDYLGKRYQVDASNAHNENNSSYYGYFQKYLN